MRYVHVAAFLKAALVICFELPSGGGYEKVRSLAAPLFVCLFRLVYYAAPFGGVLWTAKLLENQEQGQTR